MKFNKKMVSRLTGFSTPVFGVSWNPPEPEVRKAQRVATFLEDRRVLFAPLSWEVPEHCVASVIEIRHFLTEELSASDSFDELSATLRAMRAACRKFLDTLGVAKQPKKGKRTARIHLNSWAFISALGELRALFGLHLARLAVEYGLDLEDELTSILPAAPTDADA